MKITEKQLLFLIHLLTDSLRKNVIGYLSTTATCRQQMLNTILNQQDNEILHEIGRIE